MANSEFLGSIFDPTYGTGYSGAVWGTEACAPTLNTMQGGYRQPLIIMERKDNIKCKVTTDGTIRFYQDDDKKSGVSELQMSNPNGNSATVTCTHPPKILDPNYRIRKLTPKECWRVMGYKDEDFNSAAFEEVSFHIEGTNSKQNTKLNVVEPCSVSNETYIKYKSSYPLASFEYDKELKDLNFILEPLEDPNILNCLKDLTNWNSFIDLQYIIAEGGFIVVKDNSKATDWYIKITLNDSALIHHVYVVLVLVRLFISFKMYTAMTKSSIVKGLVGIEEILNNAITLRMSNLQINSIIQKTSDGMLYKQAGNAIVKDCLEAIFRQLNIKDVETWNSKVDKGEI